MGCGFGATACGSYCYAQFLPVWTTRRAGVGWGERVLVKENLPDVLAVELGKMTAGARERLRIFFSPVTDPYQPVEARHGVSRAALETLRSQGAVDLVLVQTRSPLVERDFSLLLGMDEAVLSLTVETDDEALIRRLGGGPLPSRRLLTASRAVHAGMTVQITVSPCLPYSDAFASRLIDTGVTRFVVDTVVDGDGAGGARTARGRYGREPEWDRRDHALALMEALKMEALTSRGVTAGFSAEGFGSVPGRRASAHADVTPPSLTSPGVSRYPTRPSPRSGLRNPPP